MRMAGIIEIEIDDVRNLGGLPSGVKDEQIEPHIASAVQKVSAYLKGVLPTDEADISRVRLAAASFAIAYALPVLNTFYLSNAKNVPRHVAETDYVFHDPSEVLKLAAYWERRGYDALRDVGRTGGSVGVTVI